ncbi:MAG: hypothetical protein VYD19_01335 [Myxococcota bacterium]|nr:hypothetical protein [Myxococcota bacterium]
MSASIDTVASNWFQVTDVDMLEEYVTQINDHLECLPSGEPLTIHHRNGQIRLTGFDMIDQSLGFYEDEEEEEWIDLEEVIAGMLAEGEVFRLTSLSWFKGRLSTMFVSVYTWDGRRETRSLSEISGEISEKLGLEAKTLDGWN